MSTTTETPRKAAPASTASRPQLDASRIAPAALDKMASFHADVVAEVRDAVSSSPVVVVGMAQNPHVRNVRAALREAGVEFTYLEYGSYFSQWKQRLAVKLWTGWPTFPMVFVQGVLVGGASELQALIGSGELQRMLRGGAAPG